MGSEVSCSKMQIAVKASIVLDCLPFKSFLTSLFLVPATGLAGSKTSSKANLWGLLGRNFYYDISSELCLHLQTGWTCPRCTFINEPTRPGCEACSTDRPDDYEVPVGYLPSHAEQTRMDRERELEEVV